MSFGYSALRPFAPKAAEGIRTLDPELGKLVHRVLPYHREPLASFCTTHASLVKTLNAWPASLERPP
jgi:hypothetical protein